jgi:hypothetical protein
LTTLNCGPWEDEYMLSQFEAKRKERIHPSSTGKLLTDFVERSNCS